MKMIYLDCSTGVSGDMLIGSLIDLGVKPSALEWELGKLGVPLHCHFGRVDRRGIMGVSFHVHGEDEACETHGTHGHPHQHSPEHSHGHGEEHPHGEVRELKNDHHHDVDHHPHGHEHHHEEPAHSHDHHSHDHEHDHGNSRNFAQICELLAASSISDRVKQQAQAIFRRIAVAEGKIHGMPAEQVHFHEVGALDSIADIVGVCIGLEQLDVNEVWVSELHDGIGTVRCAHGVFPLPAPATVEILQGKQLRQINVPHELITPTGAAVVAELGQGFCPMPPMTIERVGYGAGGRNLVDRPNVLRAILGEIQGSANLAGAERDVVWELECTLDDQNPELTAHLTQSFMQQGALDVVLIPCLMKKGRPGLTLKLLTDQDHRDFFIEKILTESSSFGLRYSQRDRVKLAREIRKVSLPGGEVEVKIGRLGDRVVQKAPEYESCLRLSEKTGRPLNQIYQEALAQANT
ncbi:MAG: nickel pincer cofactor biosynthesis protein LarC [Verrucomicrobiales bacterium]